MAKTTGLFFGLFFTLIIGPRLLSAQTYLHVAADTVRVANGELIIDNSTNDIKGLLINTGNGITNFQKLHLTNIGDSAIAIVGQDTLGLNNFVDLNSPQTVTGRKTFEAPSYPPTTFITDKRSDSADMWASLMIQINSDSLKNNDGAGIYFTQNNNDYKFIGEIGARTLDQTTQVGQIALAPAYHNHDPGYNVRGLLVTATSDSTADVSVSNGNLDVNGTAEAQEFKVSDLNTAPASATAPGTKGEIRITAGDIYVCIATDTWVRTPLSGW